MAKRIISIADEKKRDAHVEIEAPKAKTKSKYINYLGQEIQSQRFIKGTEKMSIEAFLTNIKKTKN